MDDKKKGIILAVLASTLWGIMGLFSRNLSLVGYSSYDISFLRCILAGIVYLVYMFITNRAVLKIDFKGLIICFMYGILSYSVSFISYSLSVERIPVAVATVLSFMSPIWVSIFGVIFFREKIEIKTVITITVCLFGCVLVSDLLNSTGTELDLIGILAGAVNGIGVALQIIIPKYFRDRYNQDTMLIYGFLGGAIFISFFTNFNVIASSIAGTNALNIIFNILAIGIICTMVANISYVKSSVYIGTSLTSILSSLQTVVGAAVGYLCFKEGMTILQIIGAVIIVVASLGSELFSEKKCK